MSRSCCRSASTSCAIHAPRCARSSESSRGSMPEIAEDLRRDLGSVVIRSPYEIVIGGQSLPLPDPAVLYQRNPTPFDRFTEGRMLRVYFNIEERGAEDLVAAVSETLNAFLVPFRFKILNNRGCYTRADGSVIYCGRRYFGILSRLVPRIYERVKD